MLLGYSSDLEEAVPSEEAHGAAGIAKRPHLSGAPRLEVDRKLGTPAARAEVVDRLLESRANIPMLRRYPARVIGPFHHGLSLS